MTGRRLDTLDAQRGLTTVEFSIVGTVLFLVLFGIIEFGRALYTVNVLTAAARRGARLAAVCPVNDTYPARAAVFAADGTNSAVVPGLTTSNLVIEYLDSNGNVISSPSPNFSDTVSDFDAIRYVRARIVNFSMPLVLPFLNPALSLNGFATTIPRESLGVPRSGTVNPC